MRFLTLGSALSVAVSATPISSGHGNGGPWWHHNAGKAVYFLDNQPAGSSVVSLKVRNDGLLSDPVRTSTDGVGAIGVNGTGFPNTADTLMSQGAVVVSGDLLFTVNAGSNTLAMFQIEPNDPWHPRLVGSPADTMGDFPMSVAYSDALHTVCVLNGGATSGVACFHVDPAQGLTPAGGLRSLAGHLHETTPPSGPPNSAGDLVFDPASTGVFALLKGNAMATPVVLGTIVGFAVEQGLVSSEPIVTQIDDLTMDFSATFLSETSMLLTDPSFGVALLELGGDLKFTESAHTVIPRQKAICWSAADLNLGVAYAIDAGRNQIYKINPDTGAHMGNIHVTGDGNPADKGIFDSAIDTGTSIMYSLVTGNGVIAVDLKAEKQIQFLDLSSFGSRQGYQGMATYPSYN